MSTRWQPLSRPVSAARRTASCCGCRKGVRRLLSTTDNGIPHQQNAPKLGLVVAVLRARSNALEDLEPLMDDLRAALVDATPGTVVRVPPEG